MTDSIALVICLIIIGIQALIVLPIHFLRKNARAAAQKEFEEYLKEMVAKDKQFAPHIKRLGQNLNILNYWLKTGKEPDISEFLDGTAESKDNAGPEIDEGIKSIRKSQFHVENMDPGEVGQYEMTFYYSTDFLENIYYCVNPHNIEKKCYKNVLYFTTCRPTQIPMVYPYKYEGAQMLSLYKHPSQAIWLLANWKLIREAMEERKEEEPIPEVEETISDFNL